MALIEACQFATGPQLAQPVIQGLGQCDAVLRQCQCMALGGQRATIEADPTLPWGLRVAPGCAAGAEIMN